MSDPVDPTVSLLTGMLIGLVHGSGQDLLKVLRVTVLPPDAFELSLASGKVLRVTVSLERGGV